VQISQSVSVSILGGKRELPLFRGDIKAYSGRKQFPIRSVSEAGGTSIKGGGQYQSNAVREGRGKKRWQATFYYYLTGRALCENGEARFT